MAVRVLAGLPAFLRYAASTEASHAALTRSRRERSQVFLELVRRGIYEHASSPYLPLLRDAGITYGDLDRLVAEAGVEGTLERLYDAGVRVTLDEFKGRRPIRRGALSVPTDTHSFDNPLLTRHFASRTGGSRSGGTRINVDLDLLEHDTHNDKVFIDMFGLASRPGSLWHPGPPGSAGLRWAIRFARVGHPVRRWFSQSPVSLRHSGRHAAFMRAVAGVSRLAGRPVVQPEYVHVSEAVKVARWLADCRARGTPAWMSTTVSCAVRVCVAARDHGLDISGTFFRGSGEPLSPAKAESVAQSGCVIRNHFATAEIGLMAMACGNPSTLDDVHVLDGKVAFLQRDIELAGGARVPAIVLSTLLWSVPKIMLNVELGDYAVKGPRSCGCTWDRLGFTEHLSTIRSYDKLTSEGMHFLGADLIALVDEVLPARFGGTPTDYQFVEEEQNGLPAVSLVMSPRLGPAADADVQAAVLNALGARDAANRMMSGLWRDGGTLRVVRQEPYATSAGKILSLHVSRPRSGDS
ncbi:MAG: hypothetical protein AB7Q29_17545 [Vicinamibacterales bacterium]